MPGLPSSPRCSGASSAARSTCSAIRKSSAGPGFLEAGEAGPASRWPICCRPGIGRPGFPFRFSEPLVDWAVESSFPFRTPDLARGCSGGSGHGADGIPPDLGFRPFRPRIVVGIGHFFARHVAVRSCSQRESVPAEESGTGADAEVSRKRSVKELRNRERNL